MKSKAFKGGIHPNDGKALTKGEAIRTAPLLSEYTVSLAQHIGAPAKAIVKLGERVLKGQKIAEAAGFVSTAIHAPTSGTITSRDKKASPGGDMEDSADHCIGPTGALVPMLTIAADGEDEACPNLDPIDWETADSKDLIARVAECGVVGMGGAAFPTHVKLSPPPGKNIDTLIINGAECEPYLSADHRQMLENAEKMIQGIRITQRILGAKDAYVGIETNKPDAIKVMTEMAAPFGIKVVPLKVMYPQGSEKQLIYAVTGRQVPVGALPLETGCAVQNTGTAVAIYEAVVEGKPLYERVTTITGEPVVNPGNWRLRVGTSLRDVLTMVGGVKDPENVGKVIIGGPMMGMAQFTLDIPTMKNTSGLLLLDKKDISLYTSGPCIRCGKCIELCPQNLMPSTMSVQIEKERFDLARDTDILSCIECGCCSYGCPSNRPLVQLFRRGKQEVHAMQKKEKNV